MARVWLVMILCCSSLAQAQNAYRWVDEQGKVHYADRPPESAVGQVEKHRMSAPTAQRQLSFATRQAMANFPVILHVSTDCGELCRKSADYLTKRGIPFAEKTLETPEAFAALAKLIGGEVRFPVLQVGSKTYKGFQETDWGSLLDAAGYPKAP